MILKRVQINNVGFNGFNAGMIDVGRALNAEYLNIVKDLHSNDHKNIDLTVEEDLDGDLLAFFK